MSQTVLLDKTVAVQPLYKSYSEIEQLSTFDKWYAHSKAELQDFYKYEVHIEAFEQVIRDKQKDITDRATLVEVLKEQYAAVSTSDQTLQNINALLDKNTFTVITAHQPSLFTGPLYFIFKTISAINLAEQLQATYPTYNFVPVFWLGSEDHDFDEISYANIFGKKLVWTNEEQGATGMMSTDSLAPVLAALKSILGNSDKAAHIFSIIEQCFTKHQTYAEATFAFVNELFKQYGLVILLTNHPKLKKVFAPYLKKELVEQPSEKLVQQAIEAKEAIGLKGQATPRAINLFYMKEGLRERIVEEDGMYQVLNTDLKFSKVEILAEVDSHPDRFSPNVILRPIFQEVLLPNLAYIGGGGELAYWMERIEQFDYFGVNFPMLIRRNSAVWVDKGGLKKLKKLGLTFDQLFENTEILIKDFVKDNTTEKLSLGQEKKALSELFKQVLAKGTAIDPTLKKTILGEQTRQMKALNNLEAKLLRAEKSKYDIAINQIRNLKDKYFPNNGLQERHDDFLAFYLKYGDGFIATLKAHFEPLNRDFLILKEE